MGRNEGRGSSRNRRCPDRMDPGSSLPSTGSGTEFEGSWRRVAVRAGNRCGQGDRRLADNATPAGKTAGTRGEVENWRGCARDTPRCEEDRSGASTAEAAAVRMRSKSTLATLRALAELGVLPAVTCERLSTSYLFLRNLEHALQYVDDAQTHRVPDDERARDRVARLLGAASGTAM